MEGTGSAQKCTICLAGLVADLGALTCGHVYHKECIDGWLGCNTSTPTCPQCKKVVLSKEAVHDRLPPGQIFYFDLFLECVGDSEQTNEYIDEARERVQVELQSVTVERDDGVQKIRDLQSSLENVNTTNAILQRRLDDQTIQISKARSLEKEHHVAKKELVELKAENLAYRDASKRDGGPLWEDLEPMDCTKSNFKSLQFNMKLMSGELRKKTISHDETETMLEKLIRANDILRSERIRNSQKIKHLTTKVEEKNAQLAELTEELEHVEGARLEVISPHIRRLAQPSGANEIRLQMPSLSPSKQPSTSTTTITAALPSSVSAPLLPKARPLKPPSSASTSSASWSSSTSVNSSGRGSLSSTTSKLYTVPKRQSGYLKNKPKDGSKVILQQTASHVKTQGYNGLGGTTQIRRKLPQQTLKPKHKRSFMSVANIGRH
eukprot:m.187273 g.187273  ORF g.187273 m.187273 type:complete len:436 (+) comp32297_c0_seq2:218-1525(+)